MSARTHLHPGGAPGKPYGPFRESASTTTHPVGRITCLRPGGGPGARYGSFAREAPVVEPDVVPARETGSGGGAGVRGGYRASESDQRPVRAKVVVPPSRLTIRGMKFKIEAGSRVSPTDVALMFGGGVLTGAVKETRAGLEEFVLTSLPEDNWGAAFAELGM